MEEKNFFYLNNKVLIVVPHPDDELNVAGVVIKNHITNANNLWILYTTNFGYHGESEAIKRYKEIQKFCRFSHIPNENIYFIGYHADFLFNNERYAYSLPGTKAIMDGEKETDENLKKGILSVINMVNPDVVISVDCDNHMDHIRASMAVDECAKEIALASGKTNLPVFIKGFAYATSWLSYDDFYEDDNATRFYDNYSNIKPYLWEDRIRIPYVINGDFSKFLSKCWMRKAYKCFATQNIYTHLTKCINSDEVFWKLKTDNCFLGSSVKISSGQFANVFDPREKIFSNNEIMCWPGKWSGIDYSKDVFIEFEGFREFNTIDIVIDILKPNTVVQVVVCSHEKNIYKEVVADLGIKNFKLRVESTKCKTLKLLFEGDIENGYEVKRIFARDIVKTGLYKIADKNNQFLYELRVRDKRPIQIKMVELFNESENQSDNRNNIIKVVNRHGERLLDYNDSHWIYIYSKNDREICCINQDGVVVDKIPIIKDRKIYHLLLMFEKNYYYLMPRVSKKFSVLLKCEQGEIMIKKVKRVVARVFRKKWKGSQNYWENRYVNGGNSGAGSYNRLAEYKAEIINDFVENNNIETVLEWGCGDGNQLKYAKYPYYIGCDVSQKAIEICENLYRDDSTKQFLYTGDNKFEMPNAELGLSLDVLYHLVEDEIYEMYLKNLISSSTKYIIIYSCNEDEKLQQAEHVKKRKFTDWMENNAKEWELLKFIENKYKYDGVDGGNTSWSDFYIYKKINA